MKLAFISPKADKINAITTILEENGFNVDCYPAAQTGYEAILENKHQVYLVEMCMGYGLQKYTV